MATTTVVSAERERACLRFSRVPHSATMNIASIATTTVLPWGKDLDVIARSNFGHGDNHTRPATCNRFLELCQVGRKPLEEPSGHTCPNRTLLSRDGSCPWTRARLPPFCLRSPNKLQQQPTCMRSPQRGPPSLALSRPVSFLLLQEGLRKALRFRCRSV